MGEFYYNSGLLTSYWLGKLSAAEQEKFEEEYFCNSEVFIALLDAKDQLISDYLNGKLAGDDLLSFERHFLTLPASKQEVELAHFFRPSPASQPITKVEDKTSWWLGLLNFGKAHQLRVGLAAAVVLIVAVWGGWKIMRPSSQPAEIQADSSAKPLAIGQAIASLSLKPRSSLRSSGKDTTAKIGKATSTIELKLEVTEETFHSYQASLRNKEREDIEVLTETFPNAAKDEDGKPIVIWQIPATQLPVGDYLVKLSGIGADGSQKPVGSYDFEVRNQMAENFQTGR